MADRDCRDEGQGARAKNHQGAPFLPGFRSRRSQRSASARGGLLDQLAGGVSQLTVCTLTAGDRLRWRPNDSVRVCASQSSEQRAACQLGANSATRAKCRLRLGSSLGRLARVGKAAEPISVDSGLEAVNEFNRSRVGNLFTASVLVGPPRLLTASAFAHPLRLLTASVLACTRGEPTNGCF